MAEGAVTGLLELSRATDPSRFITVAVSWSVKLAGMSVQRAARAMGVSPDKATNSIGTQENRFKIGLLAGMCCELIQDRMHAARAPSQASKRDRVSQAPVSTH